MESRFAWRRFLPEWDTGIANRVMGLGVYKDFASAEIKP
jgi:hypothetical protein